MLGLGEKGEGEVNVRMAGNQLQASFREGLMTPQPRLSRKGDYISDHILYSVQSPTHIIFRLDPIYDDDYYLLCWYNVTRRPGLTKWSS